MKRIGLWLLKNNIHIMTLIFLGWAVWGICNWGSLALVQKLVLGVYFLIICHEYEESYEGGLLSLFGRVVPIDTSNLTPGNSHIAQAVYITVSDHAWIDTDEGFLLCQPLESRFFSVYGKCTRLCDEHPALKGSLQWQTLQERHAAVTSVYRIWHAEEKR